MSRMTFPRFVPALTWWIALAGGTLKAEAPLVVFDLPFTVECREVTPRNYEASYQRKVFEAVFRISPQLLAGEEKDLKQLHYEISTEQQMPIVSYLPNSQVASDVEGNIAIKTSEHHGQLLVHYFFTPAAGDGRLQGDLESSNAQFMLLAPKQLLLATGTIQRGCGVFYELKPSTQDTLQKPREYACLFEVPSAWRADYAKVTCQAKGVKRSLLGASEVHCGIGMLSVGLYKQNDGEARAFADELARKQQAHMNRLVQEAGTSRDRKNKADLLAGLLGGLDRVTSTRTTMKAKQTSLGVGAALQGQISEDKGVHEKTSVDVETTEVELAEARASLRKLNGK